MGTVKSEQAKGLTLERRRRRMRRRMKEEEDGGDDEEGEAEGGRRRPTYVYKGPYDNSTIIAHSFVQVPSFQRTPLPLSSRFTTQNAFIKKLIHYPLIPTPHKYKQEFRKSVFMNKLYYYYYCYSYYTHS